MCLPLSECMWFDKYAQNDVGYANKAIFTLPTTCTAPVELLRGQGLGTRFLSIRVDLLNIYMYVCIQSSFYRT